MAMPLWLSNLAFWSVQVALLVLAAALLPRALKLRQPRVLLVYWRSLLAISLLLPFVQPWQRSPNRTIIPLSNDFAAVSLSPPPTTTVTHWHFPSLQSIAPVVGIVILTGIALRFAIFALGLLKLRRLRQTSSPLISSAESAAVLEEMRALVTAPAEFRLSTQVDSPVTFGFVSPVVLLPQRFTSLDHRFQSAIACHELLHVRRHDWVHHLGEEALRALFWFHPAIAWLISRIRLAREQVVDLEVVELTSARKAYLEALLEFTNSRGSFAAIPAPPFLAERQLVERVTLMLKEVPMSRRRLIASLTVISCCLVLVITLVAWTFPLKGAPRTPKSMGQADVTVLPGKLEGGVSGGVPGGIAQGGISGGVAEGVPGEITGGINGGISGAVSTHASSDEPTVDYSTIWVDTVRKGPMVRQVRGLGTLLRAEGSANLIARVTIPAFLAVDVKTGQNAAIFTQKGALANGHVSRLSPSPSMAPGLGSDTRTVDVALDAVPVGATAGLEVNAVIDIEKLDNILHVGRPVQVAANSTAAVFKILPQGTDAVRVTVKFGRSSVNTIEILSGLTEGDKLILSDMSSVGNAERIRLTDGTHVLRH